MVIDDNITNLNVAKGALADEYKVLLMSSGEQALEAIPRFHPDLILLDVEMPEMNGFEVLAAIKEMGHPYDEVPVIFVTAKDDRDSEFEGLDLGAVDYIIKPFSQRLLKKRVILHLKLATQQIQLQNYSHNLEEMVADQVETIKKLQYAIVHVLADMVERRDGLTGAHLIRTSEYLKVLLRKAKEDNIYDGELLDAPINEYAQASQLHDIGKIAVPDGILLKETSLTDSEYQVMKTHTLVGETIISEAMKFAENSAFLQVASEFAVSHHEKWDGSGYPRGLKGEEIPICGRLMAIADVYDALVSSRSYKVALTHEETLEIMYQGDGSHFDPVLMGVFREIHEEFKVISQLYQDRAPIRVTEIQEIR